MNGYIVAYILRTKKSVYGDEYSETDHYIVFCDDKCEEKSLEKFNHLCNGGNFSSLVEVYSVNRCKIINSPEATYLNIPV